MPEHFLYMHFVGVKTFISHTGPSLTACHTALWEVAIYL